MWSPVLRACAVPGTSPDCVAPPLRRCREAGTAIAMLLEHYNGILPFWLAPEQVAVAPISHDVAAYAREVMGCLAGEGLRPVLYEGRETLARRIVAAREARVPLVAVLGRREAEGRSVSLREFDGAQSSIPLDQIGEVLAVRRH